MTKESIIIINILRISSDSKYLEFNVDCDRDYYFTTLYIRDYREPISSGKQVVGKDFSSIFEDDQRTNWAVRIPLDELSGPSMYYVYFGVQKNDNSEEDNSEKDNFAMGVCSDISTVYKTLLNDLLSIRQSCACDLGVSENVKRIFAILYGHIEAMKLQRYSDAEYFYSLIQQNFGNCEGDYPVNNSYKKSCNCH